MSAREWSRLRRVFRVPSSVRAVGTDVDTELRFHIEGRIEDLMSQGMSREQAEAEARRRFGDVERIGNELRTIDRERFRRQARGEWLNAIGQDARLAFRGMLKRPLYTIVVVLTLALGIGANTAIFSVVNAVLLHPVEAPALDRLVVIREDLLAMNLLDAQLSAGEALDIFARKDLFQAATAYSGSNQNLTGLGEPQRLGGVQTMGEFFTVFGVRPYIGRLYRPEDSVEGSPRVVVLSYTAWQEIAGGDRAIVGRSIELNGLRHEVIGVLPPEFAFPRAAQIYLPLSLTERVLSRPQRHSLNYTVIARLRPDVTAEQLRTQLGVEAARWTEQFDGDPKTFQLRAVPFIDYLAGKLRPILLVLMGAVVLVLLIACANVASLQLVRAAGRSKEVAVRAALGAGRGAIVRQLLVESLVLALAGGALGVVIGGGVLQLLRSFNSDQYRMLSGVTLDARVLMFTGGVAILAGLAFGIFPALRASRVDLQDALKESTRGSSIGTARHRFLQGSVILQIALTLVLLLASALTIRSLAHLLETDPGFRPDQVMTMRVVLPGSRYDSPAARMSFFTTLVEKLRSIPGIRDVGLSAYLPFGGGGDSSPFELPSRPARPNEPARHANTRIIEGDYFRAMGIPLLRGRAFTPSDQGDDVVAIIDETLAKSFFGDEDPVGQQISQGRPATIVGVVRAVTHGELGEPPHPTVYYHFPQYAWLNFMFAVMRTSLPDESAVGLARAAVRQLDPTLPVFDVKTMPERIKGSLAPRRLAMAVLAGFAALSLVLALLGIYGVISYSTAQRTQEIGIRVALGARPQDVTRMILRSGLALALIGLAAGTLLFMGASRVVGSLLYGISARDPLTIVGGIIVLSGIAMVASYVPARRASRVDPLVALRAE
jgi:predicted permease